MEKLKVLDLFSGIGGFTLGLDATGGFETIAFCEIEGFQSEVLNRHWPDTPIFSDIKKLDGSQFKGIDVLCGGFPCQPFSQAGPRRGKDDERHLWPEIIRIIKQCKPTWVCCENVAGITQMALEDVCCDLEGEGYEVQPLHISSAAVGTIQSRKRVWILAHRNERRAPVWRNGEFQQITQDAGVGRNHGRRAAEPITGEWWQEQPRPYGVLDGVPERSLRNDALGNAVVPEIVTIIGGAILQAEREKTNST